MDHTKPNLRISEAKELEAWARFDHAEVTTPSGEKLGEVEGFVVDTQLGGPSYVVVDAGGWFTSRYFLLPIKNAQLDQATPAVTADLTREEVREFPGFDKDEFSSITDDELGRLTSASSRL